MYEMYADRHVLGLLLFAGVIALRCARGSAVGTDQRQHMLVNESKKTGGGNEQKKDVKEAKKFSKVPPQIMFSSAVSD